MAPDQPPADGVTGGPEPPGGWPNIADYWPDAPQRMGPPADVHEDPAAAPTRIGPLLREQMPRPVPADRPAEQPRRRRVRPLLGTTVTVLVLLAGGAVAYRKTADRNPVAQPRPAGSAMPAPSGSAGPAAVLPKQNPSPSTSSSAPPASTAPATGPATGTFWLVDDVTEISLSTGRVPGGIARVRVPDGSNAVPKATTDGNSIRLAVGSRGGGGSTRIEVQLDNRISWAIRLGGGARHMTLDLGGATVRSVAFERGVAGIDLTLPRLSRTLPIRMTGGVNQWRIGTDGQVAVRVVARGGAGQVVLYGDNRGGLARGERVSANGGSGIDVDATAGFGTLTVART
jgi:hypothetical protein